MPSLHPWLQFDPRAMLADLSRKLREAVHTRLSRKGAIVAVSGGIDSSVCAALAVVSLGKQRVFAVSMPEKESSHESTVLSKELCNHLGIPMNTVEIGSTLEAIGCYRWRDDAIRSVFPDFGAGWKSKIVIAQNLLESNRLNFFKLVIESSDGERMERRLDIAAYLEIVAATSFKQRIRKTIEYFHADRLHYAVIGTPNRLEYDQGFFVKNGDGSADVKPIAHLYKSQVYALARHLGLPDPIVDSSPTTDTYSLPQGQDEFYFVLPYDKMDIVLAGMNTGRSVPEVAREVGLQPEQVERVFQDIRRKRMTTLPLHMKPILLDEVPEIST